ncbi:hypothetical protein JE008_03215 [Pseudomonas aeruginosa]|nr:hypothetical protein [Pseudomonas aeruginosa]
MDTRVVEVTAQPSPAQAEQAEAEQPEVVAWQYRVTAGPQTGWSLWHPGKGEEFERSYTVERRPLMTVAQHDRIVGVLRADLISKDEIMRAWQRAAERKNQIAADAQARVAKLELGIARIAGDFLPDNSGQAELALDEMRQALHELLAAAPTQAQHSVPEEFSFEYRHPNGESHTVTVSRDQVINEMPDFLFEALCSKFCNCEPVGETNVVECCCDEYAEEFKLLAAAPGNSAQHSVPEGYRLIRLEHFAAIKAQLNPEQVDAYRGRNVYDEDKVYANWDKCRSALDEIKEVFEQIDWDAENELAEILAASPGKKVGHE